MKRFVPLIILLVMAGWIAGNWMPPKIAKGGFDRQVLEGRKLGHI